MAKEYLLVETSKHQTKTGEAKFMDIYVYKTLDEVIDQFESKESLNNKLSYTYESDPTHDYKLFVKSLNGCSPIEEV